MIRDPKNVEHRLNRALREKILEIAKAHSAKSSKSAYDWKVVVAAIGRARETVLTVSIAIPENEYLDTVIKELYTLLEHHSDPDGEYTSGKGAIGDLLYDVIQLKKKQSP